MRRGGAGAGGCSPPPPAFGQLSFLGSGGPVICVKARTFGTDVIFGSE